MERILTSEQMRLADKFNIENLGISKDILVDRAGMAVADEIDRRFLGGRVLVCIGKGNNGEDGRIVADVLSRKHGFSVATLTVSNGIFKIFDKKFDIIVDCIFGTGLNREVLWTQRHRWLFRKAGDLRATLSITDRYHPKGVSPNRYYFANGLSRHISKKPIRLAFFTFSRKGQ